MKKINDSWFKHSLILLVSIVMGISTLNAQEIEVTNDRVKIISGTGRLDLLSHNGELLYQQNTTGTWAYGITSRVNGNNQRGFQVKNSNWVRVFEVRGDGVVIANGQALTSDSIYKEEISPLG